MTVSEANVQKQSAVKGKLKHIPQKDMKYAFNIWSGNLFQK